MCGFRRVTPAAITRLSYFRPNPAVKRIMRRSRRTCPIIRLALLATLAALPAHAQAPPPVQIAPAPVPQSVTDGSMQISWQVRNRFRLFREERDFLLHAESMRGGSVLPSA